MPEKYTVELYRTSAEDPTSTSIYAAITERGDVHVVGQTLGSNVNIMGGDETEYIASVACEHKDRLLAALIEQGYSSGAFDEPGPSSEEGRDKRLLALIERAYSGNDRAVHDFYAFAQSKGIRAGWFRWP
jgi:hypothetical protein